MQRVSEELLKLLLESESGLAVRLDYFLKIIYLLNIIDIETYYSAEIDAWNIKYGKEQDE